MTWEVKAVNTVGTEQSTIGGVTVDRVIRGINGFEQASLSIPTLHADATAFDLFSHEIQLWLDGSFYGWFRPARLDANREGDEDTLAVVCDGLFSYLHDAVVGGEKENHLTSPHEDTATVGNTPNEWTVTSGVEDAAIVDNNAEFWDTLKAIQLNNSEAGQDAYAYQRYTVTSALAGVPFAAAATVFISDDDGGSPAYGGSAYNDRGLMIHRLDGSTFEPLSKPQVARITDETPRNAVVRLQTPEVTPAASGEVIEVRLYAPDAWTVWRWAGLFDGRWLAADRVDKSQAVVNLVTHAQDTSLNKTDQDIGTDVVSLGETVSLRWPWWRRDVVGEQIEDLADTFEFEMDFPVTTPGSATRVLKVRSGLGTAHAGTLTKADFVGWGLGLELPNKYSRVYRQGDGQGIARDEWRANDATALGGKVRESLTFGTPGEGLAQLRDNADEHLDRVKNLTKLPRARVTGSLATSIRPGDTVTVDLDHGWAQFSGDARAMQVELVGPSRVAFLDLEPV